MKEYREKMKDERESTSSLTAPRSPLIAPRSEPEGEVVVLFQSFLFLWGGTFFCVCGIVYLVLAADKCSVFYAQFLRNLHWLEVHFIELAVVVETELSPQQF